MNLKPFESAAFVALFLFLMIIINDKFHLKWKEIGREVLLKFAT